MARGAVGCLLHTAVVGEPGHPAAHEVNDPQHTAAACLWRHGYLLTAWRGIR